MPARRAHAATKPMLGFSSRVLTLGPGICQAISTACLASPDSSRSTRSWRRCRSRERLRGFEELGTRQPEMSALEASTGWKPTRMFDEAI